MNVNYIKLKEMSVDYPFVKYYDNAALDKNKIFEENSPVDMFMTRRGDVKFLHKAGVFMWIHKNTGRKYIGCSFRLAKYLHTFYPDTMLLDKIKTINNNVLEKESKICKDIIEIIESKDYIESVDNEVEESKIRKDILCYGHSEFSLTILCYLERGKDKYETNKSLHKRIVEERHRFIDLIKPEYNAEAKSVAKYKAKVIREAKARAKAVGKVFVRNVNTKRRWG